MKKRKSYHNVAVKIATALALSFGALVAVFLLFMLGYFIGAMIHHYGIWPIVMTLWLLLAACIYTLFPKPGGERK